VTIADPRAFIDASMTEEEWLQQVRELARLKGWRIYHTRDSRRSDPGFPDLVLVRGDRLIFAELKREKGRLTESQRTWLAALEETAETHVWRPSDWEAVIEVLA
jgi:signal-transduction protein with cAMP-binding, CBS, and nucleotidyltransferase domain